MLPVRVFAHCLANEHPLRSPSIKVLLVFQNWFDRAKLAIEKLVERVGFVGILACASVGSNPFPIFFFRLLSISNLRLHNTRVFFKMCHYCPLFSSLQVCSYFANQRILCRWWDLNRGILVLKVTVLPSAPHPLPLVLV